MLDGRPGLDYTAAHVRNGAGLQDEATPGRLITGNASPSGLWKAVLLVVALFAMPAGAAGEFKAHGVLLPNGAVRVAEERYRLPESFDATAKWYSQVYKPDKFPRRRIINQPGVKAIHIVNPEQGGEWEGLNLYEYRGEVRLFILVRQKKT